MTPERIDISPRPVGRIAAWIARQVERGLAANSELTLPQYRVLGLLAESNELPSSLAHKLNVQRPSITAVVDGLVARGLVTRTPAEDDRRQVSHAITTEGRKVLAVADTDVNDRLVDIASCLDSEKEAAAAVASIELWGKALANWGSRQVAGAGR